MPQVPPGLSMHFFGGEQKIGIFKDTGAEFLNVQRYCRSADLRLGVFHAMIAAHCTQILWIRLLLPFTRVEVAL